VRIPFPERFPIFKVFVFAIVLSLAQLVEGTSTLFVLCTFCFIMVSSHSFNLAGGLTRPSGGFIFAWTLLGGLFGITWKAIIGEPGNSNLLQPDRTIEVYLGTAVAMLVGVHASRTFRFKGHLPKFKVDGDMYRASVGCLIVGGLMQLVAWFSTSSAEGGSLRAALQQGLGGFLLLAIVLAVTYQLKKSGGRSSMNVPAALACAFIFAGGLIGYSKQGIFTPIVCWFFPVAAARYKTSIIQAAILVVGFGLMVYYLVPYSQIGRTYRIDGAPFSVNLATNILLLSHLDAVRKYQHEHEADGSGTDPDAQVFAYYNESQGFADRLQMLTPDDAAINVTENGAVFGILPTVFAFENMIPHFIWKSKPIINFGNLYAHEIGILTDSADTSTGISFSPAGDAYHEAKWAGVLLLLPALFSLLFTLSDSIGGDTRNSPFGLLMIINFMHSAPEGMVAGVVGASVIGMYGTFFAAFVTAYIMPLFATLIIGPSKRQGGDQNAYVPIPAQSPSSLVTTSER
jgi:hypothetical protein